MPVSESLAEATSVASNEIIQNPDTTVKRHFSLSPNSKAGYVPSAEQQRQENLEHKPLTGWYTEDLKADAALSRGYPVLDGVQVVPFRTWVKALDRGNYGLVVGRVQDNKLVIRFQNKEEGVIGEAALEYGMLQPVDGAYSMTNAEWESFLAQEPIENLEEWLTPEELAELEEMADRSYHHEEKWQSVNRNDLSRKAAKGLEQAERQLLKDLKVQFGASYFADRQYLKNAVQKFSDIYLRDGTVRPETCNALFEDVYKNSMVEDRLYYEKYKHILEQLKTTKVTISEQDQADIADFAGFKRRSAFILRISKEGGVPVGDFYRKLQDAAPELFPAEITHPVDQLQRMYAIGSSIKITRESMQDYARTDKKLHRQAAWHAFEKCTDAMCGRLWEIARYTNARNAEKEGQILTKQEAKESYAQKKDFRRKYEKMRAKHFLTDHDDAIIGDLLRGKRTLEGLDPETENIRGITAVYELKKEYEDLSHRLAAYKKACIAKLYEDADRLLKTAHKWKDKKSGLSYAKETMTRNVEDIVDDPALAKEINSEYFEPVAVREAEATRFKTNWRDRVRRLRLSRKVTKGDLVSEAYAVQLLGEAQDNIRILNQAGARLKHRDGKTLAEWNAAVRELWNNNPHLDQIKIQNAVEEFRKIYDELFELVNDVRVQFGYEPFNYRSGYFPHFQPGGDSVLSSIGMFLGISTDVDALPTTINGITHTFKPGTPWFGNAQERLGYNTVYDAVEGFDKYIEGVAGIIYQTENIQKLRALASRIRYHTSKDEGVKDRVDEILENETLTEEQKQEEITKIYEKGEYTLSNFAVELDEYTNLLANKKSFYDRIFERLFGRKVYRFFNWYNKQVAGNMIIANISSALTNYIPLTQAAAQMDRFALVRGMWGTIQAMRRDDGIVGMSTFLTNRKGNDPLVKSWSQNVADKIGGLMEIIDQFTAGSIVRGAYWLNLQNGLSNAEAMHQADLFAARIMADRSKGAMPTLFEARNPFAKAFTQFQLEVNNQFSEVFKDLPRGFKEKTLGALAWMLFKYWIFAYLFNDLFEKLFGRRPALDPIGILNEAIGDFTGYAMPNLFELGEGFETERVGVGEGITNLTGNVVEQLPFVSGLTMFGLDQLLGEDVEIGRVAANSALVDFSQTIRAATDGDWDWKKRLKVLADELGKPITYLISPFGGGNQVAKTAKGLAAYFQGGSYNVDAEGNDLLQYPVYDDFWSLVRAMLMGKNALPEAQDWVESEFDSFGKTQTAVYQDLLEAGVDQQQAYTLVNDLRMISREMDKGVEAAQRKMLRESDAPGVAKAIAYYGLAASDSEKDLMDGLANLAEDPGEIFDLVADLQDAKKTATAGQTEQRCEVLLDSKVSDEGKLLAFRSKVSDTRDDTIAALQAEGVSVDQFIEIYSEYARINVKDMSANEKAVEFSRWVNQQEYTVKQADAIRDELVYYNMSPASAGKYDKMVVAGLDADDAYELTDAMEDLEPLEGADRVEDVQRWRLCVDFSGNVSVQLSALRGVMDDSQYRKVETAYDLGVEPDLYITLYEIRSEYDANSNGSYTQAEMKAAIDSMKCSTSQKAVLWQLGTGAKSAKNNPYSTTTGQAVLDAKGSQ